MKNFAKIMTLALVIIMSATTNFQLQAGRGGAIAGGLLGGMAIGGMMASANNSGRARDAYYQGRQDAQYEQARYADRASYDRNRELEYCSRLPRQQRLQCFDRFKYDDSMRDNYMRE